MGRATFYLHYANKDALLDDVLGSLFDELTAAGQTFVTAMASDDGVLDASVVVNLFELLKQRRTLYRTLFRTSSGLRLADRLQAFHEGAFIGLWQQSTRTNVPGSPSVEYRARYVAAAVRGVIDLWLNEAESDHILDFGAWTQQMTLLLLLTDTCALESPRSGVR